MRLICMLIVISTLPFVLKKLKRRETIVLFVGYVLAVLVITLGFRTPFREIHYRLNPFHEYMNIGRTARSGYVSSGIHGACRAVWKDFETLSSPFLNILLFMPLGYMVPKISPFFEKWWKVILLGFAFSLVIETTQLVTRLGWFDIADLMNNTIGAALGFWVFGRCEYDALLEPVESLTIEPQKSVR